MGGASLITGIMGNNAQAGAARRAGDQQAQLVKRQSEAFDLLKGVIANAEASGQWDPNKRIAMQNAILDNAQSLDLGNQATAARVLGYRPGDSAPIDGMRATSNNYKLQKQAADQSIINDVFSQKLGAYGMLNSGSGSLNSGIAAAGDQQRLALSQLQSPAGFLSAYLPYIMQGMGKGGASNPPVRNSVIAPAPQGGGFSGGFGGSGRLYTRGNGGFGN